eukprot:CAMPEP_0194385344 /NCGR_PEP_ID=MMETSP0174-20130528/79735_1 /TAXON_ID=216777 /ORGANISM="Proboscia alata, Strain PI-D3" /LENGTH=117 /DNA_ID=CAMNT_0039173393 /DNA_START=141 /DNA_END=492 /DNA_ORIENTATION=+
MSIATVDLRHYCERLGDILLHVSKVMGGARCPDDTERTDRVARPSLPFQFRVESPNTRHHGSNAPYQTNAFQSLFGSTNSIATHDVSVALSDPPVMGWVKVKHTLTGFVNEVRRKAW